MTNTNSGHEPTLPETARHEAVLLDDAPLGMADLVSVAQGADLQLGPAARRRIAESRAVVDRFVEGPELIYGLNTGLGHMRDVRMPLETLKAYQAAIVTMHAGGIGEPLPRDVVRAAMTVRVAGIARGGAGATPAVADTLVAMLNAGVTPLVPSVGSVGASDLMHMAAIALVAIGRGEAHYQGQRLAGGEAMRRAGIPLLEMGPKDGLALVSANGVAVGHSALVAARALDAARLADVVVAVTMEAVRGNVSVLDPVVARAKPVPSQAESAARILSLLEGSSRCVAGSAVSVQDPLSFRVVPQVHGAFGETIRFLVEQVEIELAAMDDNPLVDVEGGRIVSNGNFHPMAMALAVDALRPAIAHVGQLSDRRLNHIWTQLFAQIDPTDVDLLGRSSDYAGLLTRYAAASRYAELRGTVEPATLDVGALDLAVEDHATNAPLAARRSDEALDLLDDLLAVELLSAADVLRLVAPDERLGDGVRAVLDEVARVRADARETVSAAGLHAAMKASLPTVLGAARDAAGWQG